MIDWLHEFHLLNIIIVLLYNNEASIGTWEANIIMFLMEKQFVLSIINIVIMFLIESTDVLSIRNIIIILLFAINMLIM